MSTTVSDYMSTFLLEHDHPYDNAVILKYINLVESNVYADNIKEYLAQCYPKVLNTFQFSLPSGVNFTEVSKLYVNGRKYKKKDTRAYNEHKSYWYENGKLCIYPACSITDTSYVSEAGEITFATDSITTTGDDFAFAAGDVVLITGCTSHTANNKAVMIASVDTDTLTFASGTFTAGAESGIIMIQKASIKVTYLNIPATKLIANIATDTLLFADRFVQVYDFFNMAKIAYLAEKFGTYANHMTAYKDIVNDIITWWENNRPQQPVDNIVADDGYSCSGYSDFDRDI